MDQTEIDRKFNAALRRIRERSRRYVEEHPETLQQADPYPDLERPHSPRRNIPRWSITPSDGEAMVCGSPTSGSVHAACDR